MPNNQAEFLKVLEKQAKIQAKLEQRPLLPRQFGALARLIARYPWQINLILSGLSAVLIELIY